MCTNPFKRKVRRILLHPTCVLQSPAQAVVSIVMQLPHSSLSMVMEILVSRQLDLHSDPALISAGNSITITTKCILIWESMRKCAANQIQVLQCISIAFCIHLGLYCIIN